MDSEINAMLKELEEQRAYLGNRAAKLAASNAALADENDRLRADIERLQQALKGSVK